MSPESKNPHTIADSPQEALEMAAAYRAWGADVIELGGQSSHYDNPSVGADAESRRIVPAVELLTAGGFVVAVDTWQPPVAAAAIEAGASIINDTGGLASDEMRDLLATSKAAFVAVHVDATNPHEVGEAALGADRAQRTADRFAAMLRDMGDLGARLLLDPGIAINYRGDYEALTDMQLQVIRESAVFAPLGRPLLIPIPRKRDIHRVAAYIALALECGADLIRVHDVALASSLVGLWRRQVPR